MPRRPMRGRGGDRGGDPWGRPPRRRPGLRLLVFLGLVAVAAILLMRAFPDALAERGDRVWGVYLLVLLVFVGSSVVARWRVPLGGTLRYAALWLGIALVVALGYSYRSELTRVGDRLLGGLLPDRGSVVDGRLVVDRSADGHFKLRAEVDGTSVRFLVDTGASHIMLSQADARRLGFDPARLSYTIPYRTANGTTFGAPVEIGSLDAGPIHLRNLPASVSRTADAPSLLGMTFLNRLSRYTVSDGRLTLVP